MSKYEGLSRDFAECFGKPHINAWYTGSGVNDYTFDHDALCPVCHRPATNAHHVCPKGVAKKFVLRSSYGNFTLRTALFAVYGSGTYGVHADFHQKRIKATWEWDKQTFEDLWWSGYLLHRYGEHAPELYDYGYWHFETPYGSFDYRGES